MDTIRNDFGSFQDPIATYTSLGGDMDGSFVADNFPFERRTSVMSASSGPTMSFGSSPTDAASSSIPTTPIGESHRSGGVLTPADVLLTPESPCPPSWRSFARQPAPHGANAFPQRYSSMCQDLTRNMMSAGTASYHDDAPSSHYMFGRDMAFSALDPIQTQFPAGVVNRNQQYSNYSHPYSAMSSASDNDSMTRPWRLDIDSPNYAQRTRSLDHSSAGRSRRSRARSSRASEIMVHKEGAHECKYPGCANKRFQRKEHLRRHQQSKHGLKKFECLQGRILGARFCNKLHGIKPISRSDNVNQHSCTHVVNGMGKTRNSLCELLVADRCIKKDVRSQSDLDKANKQVENLRQQFNKNVEDSASKPVKTAKPKPNVHIAHEVMESLGFDCSDGCPMGELHVFDGDGSWGPLCMAFIGNPEPRDDIMTELDGSLSPTTPSRHRKSKL